jgi:glycosyltransferase involved in cell wall biosynthesis
VACSISHLVTQKPSRGHFLWLDVNFDKARRLGRLIPNVHLTGAKAHEELSEYIRGFDVGIVPYLWNTYTATVVPTKINEYLAMGKPVVSTNLPEVSNFNGKHGVIITSPNRPVEFVASIERALTLPGGASVVTRRQTVAALNGWEERFERMSRLIELELRKKRGDSYGGKSK